MKVHEIIENDWGNYIFDKDTVEFIRFEPSYSRFKFIYRKSKEFITRDLSSYGLDPKDFL